MTRPREQLAPHHLGRTPTDRARVIARACYQALADPTVDRAKAAREIRKMAALFREDVWLTARPDTTTPGGLLTRDQVAEIGHVSPDTVSNWSGRGLRRGDRTHHLTRHPDGYDPDEVAAFLRLRDTPTTPGSTR